MDYKQFQQQYHCTLLCNNLYFTWEIHPTGNSPIYQLQLFSFRINMLQVIKQKSLSNTCLWISLTTRRKNIISTSWRWFEIDSTLYACCYTALSTNRTRGYKTCSSQQSRKFFLLKYVKMPSTVDILTFMSRKYSILGWSEPKKCWISEYFYTYEH